MVEAAKMAWGQYKGYEGPRFGGVLPYQVPPVPDFLDKCLAVVVATEGGCYDSINMYDTCVLSTGLIQCCEGLFLTSRMLGTCPKDEVQSWLDKLPIPAEIKKNSAGRPRFHFKDGREVDTKDRMREIFFGGSPGLVGKWNQESDKDHARQVAAIMASMWGSYSMRRAQVEFVKPILATFVKPTTTAVLTSRQDQDSWWGALRALVLSFSVNLPAVADKFFMATTQDPNWASASDEEKFFMAAKRVTFGPDIGLWRARYRDLQPVLKTLFHVDAPTLAELAAHTNDGSAVAKYGEEDIDEVIEIQRFLVSQGFDLGPSGPDGVMGFKTKSAIRDFQASHGLVADGAVGPATRGSMLMVMNSKDAETGNS